MARIVNTSAISERFATLGWTNLNLTEIISGLQTANVAAPELIAYLDALIAAPAGTDDATITGCTPADATKITTYLKSHGAVAV